MYAAIIVLSAGSRNRISDRETGGWGRGVVSGWQSNSEIISVIKWIRTNRLLKKNYFGAGKPNPPPARKPTCLWVASHTDEYRGDGGLMVTFEWHASQAR